MNLWHIQVEDHHLGIKCLPQAGVFLAPQPGTALGGCRTSACEAQLGYVSQRGM